LYIAITSIKKSNCKNRLKKIFKNYIAKIELLLRKEYNIIISKDSTIFYLFAFYIQVQLESLSFRLTQLSLTL